MSDGPTISAGMIHKVQRLHKAKWGGISFTLSEAIGRKVAEEAVELAIESSREDLDVSELAWEIGDVLFAAIAACRIADVDPEQALAAAIKRNRERWRVD